MKKARRAPAIFKPGSAAGPAKFDPEEPAKLINLWWVSGAGRTYLVRSDEYGEWDAYQEDKVYALLREKFVSNIRREGELLTEAKRVLLWVMKHRRVERSVASIAGYPEGVHIIDDKRVIVRTGPKLVYPVRGAWPTVRALIEAKLGLRQAPFFHAWMKTALESLNGGPGNFRPGQCCVFAGPRDSGKSRLQHQIITGLLGGRSADPGPYLLKRTDFNSELIGAEHLMMEDLASSTKSSDRHFFGEMLKQFIVNDTQRLHRKGHDAIGVSPFHRLSISINDDPDKMRALPLMTPDIKDKVHLFLVTAAPLPLPTASLEERAQFRRVIAAELPAYAWWLGNEFEIPASMSSARFGVQEWHHPDLLLASFEDTPAAVLLQIMDAAEFTIAANPPMKLWEVESKAKVPNEWEGSALELERLLLNERGWSGCTYSERAKRLCQFHKIDRLLARLKEDQPQRVRRHRGKMERRWVVKFPFVACVNGDALDADDA